MSENRKIASLAPICSSSLSLFAFLPALMKECATLHHFQND